VQCSFHVIYVCVVFAVIVLRYIRPVLGNGRQTSNCNLPLLINDSNNYGNCYVMIVLHNRETAFSTQSELRSYKRDPAA
jgi:hypothetical protein